MTIQAEEKRAHPPHHKSEYVDMHAAHCDENPKNAETSPCITHRLKATTPPLPRPLPLTASRRP